MPIKAESIRIQYNTIWQCGILHFLYYAETKSHIFIFAILESIFSKTVWSTMDDRFSNFVLPLYRNEATFLDFRLF